MSIRSFFSPAIGSTFAMTRVEGASRSTRLAFWTISIEPVQSPKLAEHMGVGRSTMSITVTRLVRGGYIARGQYRNDLRCVGLTLTPLGERVKEQNTVLEPDSLREMFRLMPSQQLEVALQGIESLAKYARILLRRRKRERDG